MINLREEIKIYAVVLYVFKKEKCFRCNLICLWKGMKFSLQYNMSLEKKMLSL